jgi:hypothetical protein
VEDQETLETSALVGKLSDAVQDKVNNFLTDGVVTTGVVVGGIFLSGDQLFRVEQLTVGSSSDFVNNSWLEIDEDTTWDVLAGTSFGEKGVEGVVTTADGLVRWHLTVWGDTVLEAVEFPAGITNLGTGLTDVD